MNRLVSTVPRLVGPNVRYFTRGQMRMVDRGVVEDINARQTKFQAADKPVHLIGVNRIHFFMTTVFGVLAFTGSLYDMCKLLE